VFAGTHHLIVAVPPDSKRMPAIRTRAGSFRICGGHSDLERVFSRVLKFPLPILIPSPALHSLIILIILSWTLYSLSTHSVDK
jgi:hypothetical protein